MTVACVGEVKVTFTTRALVEDARGSDASEVNALAYLAPSWRSDTLVAGGVCPLKNSCQSLVMAATAAAEALGRLGCAAGLELQPATTSRVTLTTAAHTL